METAHIRRKSGSDCRLGWVVHVHRHPQHVLVRQQAKSETGRAPPEAPEPPRFWLFYIRFIPRPPPILSFSTLPSSPLGLHEQHQNQDHKGRDIRVIGPKIVAVYNSVKPMISPPRTPPRNTPMLPGETVEAKVFVPIAAPRWSSPHLVGTCSP